MLLDLADYEIKTRSAVKMFWTSGREFRTKKRAGGKMDGFIDLVIDIVHANGLTNADILWKNELAVLPGHFCPTQSWDLLVMNHGKLIAALKFESLVSASFSKNNKSVCKDALTIAMDLQATYRQGTFGEYRRPFVGYLVLLEDCPASRTPVRDVSPNYHLLPEFRGASFADRYKILCEKMIAEGLYAAASVILSPRTASKTGAYSEVSNLTGLKPFVEALAGHIAVEAAM